VSAWCEPEIGAYLRPVSADSFLFAFTLKQLAL
jgi:hypothetical protein